MLPKIFKGLFGSRNQRVLKRLQKIVRQINDLEPTFQALSDEALRNKTQEFKERLAKDVPLDDLLPEAFAAVREASVRTLTLRHFDMQLVGGMVLHHGNIAEMLTGEGKTLVATLAAYLNALAGDGVHIVTVNDYLAKRDAAWMAPIYELLGLTVGVNLTGMSHADKQEAYRADITYGTNNEFGFDYLRDNMAFSLSDRVQRSQPFAIIDEVDSILIDEARTPLIISGPAENSSERYQQINTLIPSLTRQEEDGPGDYSLDEKTKQAFLTEAGHQHIEELLLAKGLFQEGESLYDAANISLVHHFYAALRAHTLFQRDVDYIVRDNQIIIVDEHTGRLMAGRRWSDGLHQAVEAKENVAIQNENQTLASITFQNYFRSYNKLSGMTGTADTEAYEFQFIYGLEVIVIPPNKPVQRADSPDKVYMKMDAKFKAIIAEIKARSEKGQPVLVGTASIEMSELLSAMLKKEKIPHEILNAKQHEREAHIIAQAGRPGVVTLATNMAGRGTDIVLGGNVEAELADLDNPSEEMIEQCRKAWKERHATVIAAGGLHVLGTERHESRRIDNQLRGRSGRQGDPGSSQFYLSLDDNLLRIFASAKLYGVMQKIGVPEGEALESSLLTRVIENAQRKVEGHNFDMRKQLLEYDDVANEQRKVVYSQRSDIMAEEDVSATVKAMMESAANDMLEEYIPLQSFEEQWDIPGLTEKLSQEIGLSLDIAGWLDSDSSLEENALKARILDEVNALYAEKEKTFGDPIRQIEKSILLQALDSHWKDHLSAMDHLRQGIHLRGYAQKNPKQEYKRESFDLFTETLKSLKHAMLSTLCRIQLRAPEDADLLEEQRRRQASVPMSFVHEESGGALNQSPQKSAEQAPEAAAPFVRQGPKIGRNEPCPCGSGKKYKQCHGRLTQTSNAHES